MKKIKIFILCLILLVITSLGVNGLYVGSDCNSIQANLTVGESIQLNGSVEGVCNLNITVSHTNFDGDGFGIMNGGIRINQSSSNNSIYDLNIFGGYNFLNNKSGINLNGNYTTIQNVNISINQTVSARHARGIWGRVTGNKNYVINNVKIRNFVMSGSNPFSFMFFSGGIFLENVNATISNVTIFNITGRSGGGAGQMGEDVVGIWIGGNSTAHNNNISFLRGGDTTSGTGGATGGSSFGIRVSNVSTSVYENNIYNLTGGNGAFGFAVPQPGDLGGGSWGIHYDTYFGFVNQFEDQAYNNNISFLTSGRGGDSGAVAGGFAGNAFGIDTKRNGTTIYNNSIQNLFGEDGGAGTPSAPPGPVIGISNDFASFPENGLIFNNVVKNLYLLGNSGTAARECYVQGISAERATIRENIIMNLDTNGLTAGNAGSCFATAINTTSPSIHYLNNISNINGSGAGMTNTNAFSRGGFDEVKPEAVAETFFTENYTTHFYRSRSITDTTDVTIQRNTSGLLTVINTSQASLFCGSAPSVNCTYIWTSAINGSFIYINSSGFIVQSNFSINNGTPVVGVLLTNLMPLNSTQFNTNTIMFNVTANSSSQFNLSLYIDNIFRGTQANFTSGVHIAMFTRNVSDGEGNHTYYFNATNINGTVTISETVFFFVDTVTPIISNINFLNSSLVFGRNLSGQFNFSDNQLLFSYNVTVDGFPHDSATNLGVNQLLYNLSVSPDNLSIGHHSVKLEIKDGHTKKEIGDYLIEEGWLDPYLKFSLYQGEWVNIDVLNDSFFDDYIAVKNKDRYKIKYKPSQIKPYYVFNVTSDKEIFILHSDTTEFKDWIVIDGHWLDFYLPNETGALINITRINDREVHVKVENLTNPLEQDYDSIGDLNVVNVTYDFYVVNLTTRYSPILFGSSFFSVNLSVDYGLLLFNTSGLMPQAILEWDNQNFTTSLLFNSNSSSFFSRILDPTTINISGDVIPHRWYFNYSNLTSGFLQTPIANQFIIDIQIAKCNASIPYPIINFNYFDEISGVPINITNTFQLFFNDGIRIYNLSGSFNGSSMNTLCSNINPINVTYNFDMYGSIILSNASYITRTLDIDSSAPILVSNNPVTNQSLFLIKIADSSTVKYIWRTTNHILVDGTMRIYRCNDDATKSLVESVTVIQGIAAANIELLTRAYSYDIIVDGRIYNDPIGYSKCHVEAFTEVNLFVNIEEEIPFATVALGSLRCNLVKGIGNSVTMSWSPNPQDASYVTGCLIGYTKAIYGNIEVYNNCSTEPDGYSRTVNINIPNEEFVLTGKLIQDDNSAICQNTLIFGGDRESASLIGGAGLFALLLLFLSGVLFYAGDGELQLLGGVVGLVAAWVLGVSQFKWITIASMIFFLGIIALIGRYSRKPT